jgi:hypothetical protein
MNLCINKRNNNTMTTGILLKSYMAIGQAIVAVTNFIAGAQKEVSRFKRAFTVLPKGIAVQG